MSMPQIYRTYVRMLAGVFRPVDELATVDNLANLVDRQRVKRLAYRLKNFSAVVCISPAQIFDACATFPWTRCLRGNRILKGILNGEASSHVRTVDADAHDSGRSGRRRRACGVRACRPGGGWPDRE